MKKFLRRIMGIDKLEQEKIKLLEQTDPKAAATAKGEAYIAVIDTQVNPDNIRNGFFELDWNYINISHISICTLPVFL